MKLFGNTRLNLSQAGWAILGCMLLPLTSYGVLYQVTQESEPAGFVSSTEAIEGGTTKQSINPTLSSNGYAFGYWAINGVRQAGEGNRSLTQVSTTISANTTFTAHYYSESADTDTDGIMDWYEYRMFGDLSQGPTDDPDSDGFTNKRESELGQDPLIVDEVEWGGISGRLSTGFTYADTSMVLAVVKSDPAGFVTEASNYLESNSTVTTSSLHGATNGYNFAYWSVNGVRQAGPTGVAVSKVSLDVNATTTIIAHYKPSNEDSDSDGVMDWFELYQFGSLDLGPTDDPDGDGFSNKHESELGQEATIADTVEWGGISGRLSTGFTYADTSMVLAVVKSDPAGFVTETSNYLEENSTVTTSSLHGATNGYNFAYWSVNGVRQAGPTGVSLSKVATDVNATTNIVAHYKPSNEDTDGDGVMDWFELYQFGNLNQSGSDDPDGDGFSNKREGELGQEATIFDNVEWGGISGRLSTGILYYQQQNRPPYDLELNNSYALLNKDVNASIGTFTPRDLDDPGVVRPYTYQLLSGAGGEDNSYFNLSGRELRASQSFTTEGNFSIQVRVVDDEGESFDKNFTIRAVDPSWDEDGDGLGLEQEFANGTNPTNPDSDGDGANDGAEVTAGTNPLDPSVFPNRSPRDLNSTTTLTILENQPVGTTVGEFNATDPDGDAITYHFVTVENNNSLFTLDTNGTLKTATIFDYESNASSYTIRLQAKDDQNATLDSQFNVMLLNIDEDPENLRADKTLEFEDTLSIGGVVGHFYADDPEGGSIQFELTDAQTPIKQVATGARHTVLLREDGVVLTAGDNFAGQLGDGTTSDRSSFVFVKDINGSVFTGVERVFAGGFTTIFIKEDQSVWITGYNNYGQLGRGDTVNARNPIQVNLSDGTALTGVSSVAAGHYHTAYIMNDGTAWICGKNEDGQLGVGSTLQKNELVRVLASEGLNLSGITGAALGLEHSLFLLSDQTVRSCGKNGSGQLGDSSFSRRLYPVAVNNNGTILGSVAEVSTGAGGNHSVFLKTDGTAWACGNDGNRELGDGNVYTGYSNKPVQVKTAMGTSSPNLENIVSVSAGGTFTSFLSASGNIYVCGTASFPPLENRQNFASPIFEQNGQIVSDVESIYAGGDDRFLVFKKTSGEIFAIGSNSQGNFGNGGKISTDYSSTIYSPNHNDRFTLESNGTLKTASAFIYESNKTNFIIDLLAKDESNQSTVRKFSISLLQGVRNFPPEDLNATSLLSISENQPIGTVISEFNATDPDENSSITYHFVTGDNNNSLFTLESNGTLKTATTFDYESNASIYTITVQAKDELNSTTEGNFTVTLLDVYEDTDGDGFRDSLEASAGSNLNDSISIPFKDGLVAWYPFDGNASDMSGNGNDGNITGSPEWVFSEGHHSIEFTEYAQRLIAPIEDFNENFSYTFWAKPTGVHQVDNTATSGTSGTLGQQYLLYPRHGSTSGSGIGCSLGTNGISIYEHRTDNIHCTSAVEQNLSGWNFYSIVAINNQVKIFINGAHIENALFTGKIALRSNGVAIGYPPEDLSSDSGYLGLIDDLRFYNKAVSPNLIEALYGFEQSADSSKGAHFLHIGPIVDLEMIWVEPGTFTMGSPVTETSRQTDETEHNVTLTKGFYLGKYEVTQAQYEAVMTGNSDGLIAAPSNFAGNPNRPVEQVSWEDVQKFLARLNVQEAGSIPEGWAYVLPTEAQWEYACRADTTTAYSWGDTISATDANWKYSNDVNSTTEVGSYLANPWGFHDMHGNVAEICADWYGAYLSGSIIDPIGQETGTEKVQRSGSWRTPVSGEYVRSASRFKNPVDFQQNNIGFRLALRDMNKAPTDLNSTAVLAFSENQQVGTIVGELNATDPEGGAITYHFLNGDNNNSLFTLDTNGTLKTATTFDYESNALSYTITVLAKDELNATTEGNFTITLLDVDDTPPNISLSGDSNITHEAGSTYHDANATWLDIVDGSGEVYGTGEVNASTPGVYVLSFNYTDNAGNDAVTVTRTVNVVDTTAPVITLNGDANVTHEAGIAYHDANATWSDIVDGSGGVYGTGDVDVSTPGVYVLSFNYTDSAGNDAVTVTRTVNVVDTTIPVITLSGDSNITHEAGGEYHDANASWSDIVDGTGVVIGTGEVDVLIPGVYVLNFDYTDTVGNEAVTVIRTVNVVDTTVPLITLNGDANVTHEAGSTYHDANATWSDIVDGSGVVIGTGDVNEDIPGIYSLSYNVTDSNGNSAHTVIREVTVYNTNPQGLKSLEGLDVHENEPIGIVVGNFGAIDANGNALSFYLIDGEGNESNSLFEMEENGTLKTAVIFDYETNASRHSIRVRASDEYNGSVDGNFTVHLLDRNEQPYDLQASASLMVEENLPAGSFVGDFVAKDPDEDILSYILVRDQNLTFPFELSKSGELVTTEVLDFERQEKYSLTVRALDANGSFQERVFDVDIIDCFIPVVNTLLPYFDENGTLQVGGEISDDGGNSQNLEVGILVSESPIGGLLGNEGVMELEIFESQNLYRFEKGMIPEKGWEKIYVRAYAKNAEGVAYGLEESILKDLPEDLSHWADARPVNGAPGWWESPWFGTFYKSNSGWMLHVELGWIYPSPGEGGSLWLWKENLDWVWTDEKLYPFLFSAKQSNWMYFYGALNQQRLLYHYGDQEWVDLDDSKVSEKQDAR